MVFAVLGKATQCGGLVDSVKFILLFIHSHDLQYGVLKQEAIKLGIIIVGTNPFIFVFVLKVFVLHVKNVCCFYLAHFVIL